MADELIDIKGGCLTLFGLFLMIVWLICLMVEWQELYLHLVCVALHDPILVVHE